MCVLVRHFQVLYLRPDEIAERFKSSDFCRTTDRTSRSYFQAFKAKDTDVK